MNLGTLDILIISAVLIITLLIGIVSSRKAGKSSKSYFLSGRNMPWWLLGVSMVATTFSADTPNLVTDIIRKNGVAGNWAWWAFLLTGMATVFIYAKLWRRSGITTDLGFYELRYSGPEASFLRGFRAFYLGVVFNVIVMATVLLAGIKIAGVMLGMSSIQTVLLVSLVTVVYSTLGGLRGVILTDFFQFIIGTIGMIAAAIFIVNMPEIGGLDNLITHPNVRGNIQFLPDFTNPEVAIPIFFIPIAVQWWSVWYPGAEPGGGGYIAQRMLSAKNEEEATYATLLFNFAHYALRPWPWILIALASMIIFPNLSDIQAMFPDIQDNILADDIAFPAMLSLLPKGLIGLVIAALISALMSTISTHLNWGSSYIVNDFLVRFFHQDASDEQQVNYGKISTVILMILAAVFALALESALDSFNIILQIGAGTGLLFILRWFWWRINAYSEITAMGVSFLVALFFVLTDFELKSYQEMLIGVGITTVCWVGVTFLTKPTEESVLIEFYKKIQPHHHGWKAIKQKVKINDIHKKDKMSLGTEILLMIIGCIMIYACLFGSGYFIYGQMVYGIISFSIAIICLYIIISSFVCNRNT